MVGAEPRRPLHASSWRTDRRNGMETAGPRPTRSSPGFRENYEAEIVAYELDKLLTLDMVPPTVERQIQGTKGSAQQWVEGVVDATDPTVPEGRDRIRWESDLLRMTMFDMLIGNGARVRTNMLRDGAWNLILINHSCLRDRCCTRREPHRG